MRRFLILLLVFVLALGLGAMVWFFYVREADDGSPPGYRRLKLEEINATVFKPNGWQVKHTPKLRPGEYEGYDLTLENQETQEMLKTKFMIHAYEKIEERTKLKASVFAISLLKLHEASGDVLSSSHKYSAEKGPFVISSLQTRMKNGPRQKPRDIMRSYITMANDKTGTCYLITFSTPEADWPANEKIFTQMSQVVFDAER